MQGAPHWKEQSKTEILYERRGASNRRILERSGIECNRKSAMEYAH